jgi:hypothetical protein
MVNILSIYYKNYAKVVQRNRKKWEKVPLKKFYSQRILICGAMEKIGKSGRGTALLERRPAWMTGQLHNYEEYLHC